MQILGLSICKQQIAVYREKKKKRSPLTPHGPPESIEHSPCLSYLLLHQLATEKETQDFNRSLVIEF